jgi:phage terminase small subunit
MAHGGARPGAGRPPKAEQDSLNPRQRRFVSEYLIDLNATRAAIAAGYSAVGATVQGSRLLSNVNVREEIERAKQQLATRLGVSAERIVEELSRIAFSDLRKAVTWRSNVVQVDVDAETGEQVRRLVNEVVLADSAQLDDATAAAIHSISQGPKGELKIRLHDKQAALVNLGKHLGLFRTEAASDGEGVVVEIRRLGTTTKRGADADS